MKDKLNYRLLNVLIAVIIFYFVLVTYDYWGFILNKVFSIVLPFVIAFAIAYVLHPILKKLEKCGIRKNIAVTLIVLVITTFIVTVGFFTIPLVYDQLVSLSKSVIEFISNANTKYDLDFGSFSDTIVNSLNNIVKDFGGYISTGTFELLGKSVNILTNFIIVYIVSIYFLIDMDSIRRKVKVFLKGLKNRRYLSYVTKLDDEIDNYTHGLATFMLIQLFEYSIIFFIVGHPNWLLLGIIASMMCIIPYFGGFISNTIAIITASVISMPLLISCLIVALIFPQVDGYFISPRIYRRTNNIKPVTVIFAVGAFGSLFGFLGIVIALPISIVIKTTLEFYRKDIKEKIEEVRD
ncbi:MAG: AI-2E family transporter [Bacilli bacterium]|nr:AI-2E family transporter [Bacilli bacterium]